MFAAGVCFTFLDTSAKYLVLSGMRPEFVSWVRFGVHLLLAAVLFRIWSNPNVLRHHSMVMQVVRGVFLFGSTIFNFAALKYLQLDETTSIAFLGPMVITALAGPLLGEWAGWRRWLAIAAGFGGMLIITRPGFGVFGLGHGFALCGMVCYALYAIMTRKMGTTETTESMIFYSALAPVVLMAPIAPASATMPSSALMWVLLLSLGIYGGLGHYMLVHAFKRATAVSLAPYPYLQIVWMIVAGYIVFGDVPDGWTIVGVTVIILSGLYIVHREHKLRLSSRTAPEEASELAKKL